MNRTVQDVVRFPDSDGFWWMNDPHAYGWEVVRVRRRPSGETVVWRTGCVGPEEIQVWCVEWVKIDKPTGEGKPAGLSDGLVR